VVNPGRRSVAPARKLVAAVLGTIAVFVMLFGLGLASLAIVALGVAMLALAIGLLLVNVVRRGGRAWVAGTAHVVSASEPPASSAYGRCELQIVVAAPGLPASAVKVRDPRVPVVKWPDAGATLPVMVAVDDMRHVRIQWDEVMTHTEAMEEPPAYVDPLRDLPVDDLLPEPEAPPWVTRDRQQWTRGTDDAEPVTADLSAQLSDLREQPVVVREAAGGPIVLEGTLVDADARPSTLPRRPRPSPRPRTTTESTAPVDDRPAEAASAGAPDPEPDPEPVPDLTDPVAAGPDPDASPEQAVPTKSTEPTRPAAADDPAEPDHELDLALDETDDAAAHTAVGTTVDADDRPVISGIDMAPDTTDPATTDRDTTAATAWEVAAGKVRADEATDDRIDGLITAYPSARPGPAGAIHGVGITVLVTDLQRSTRFYRDMLGFFEIDSGGGSAVLASGDTRLVLRTVHDMSPQTGRLIYLNLEVGDVEAVYGELRAKGVEFVHEPRTVNRGDRLELWAASFHDPDGHNVAITQWRAVG
jgi:catechol 2,3-dioxygenase-like lactoylglutathione lyase family enzyme